MRGSYNTLQKEKLLEIISNFKREFCVKDIISMNPGVGLTTIYRFIDKLVDDGLLKKNIGNDNITYYSYLENCDHKNHFYLKCDNCGELIHVDCDCIDSLSKHIKNEHNFKLSKNNFMINGLCSKCNKRC